MTTSRVTTTLLGVAFLFSFACGGAIAPDLGDGGTSAEGDGATSDPTSDAGSDPGTGTGDGGGATTTADGGTTKPAPACTSAANCAKGQVCCVVDTGGRGGNTTSACQTSCGGGGRGDPGEQLCAKDSECPRGMRCTGRPGEPRTCGGR
ncbi:MAG: hypothetical protein JWM74_5672 [Myxococcaceae bacterium]|nr:hypothetical protein [Myxococcaceae bacterium]